MLFCDPLVPTSHSRLGNRTAQDAVYRTLTSRKNSGNRLDQQLPQIDRRSTTERG